MEISDNRNADLRDAARRTVVAIGSHPGVQLVAFDGVDQAFPPHFHDFWTIGHLTGGAHRMCCRGEEALVSAGDLVLLAPGEAHACRPAGSGPLSYRSVTVPVALFADVLEANGVGDGAHMLPGVVRFASPTVRDAKLEARMNRLCDLALATPRAEDLEIDEALYALLDRAARFCEPASSARQPHAERIPTRAPSDASRESVRLARELIDRRFAEGVTLDELASLARMSRYALVRAFSQVVGLTPHRYLQAARAGHAREMLEAGAQPSEAAVSAGFSDQAHMTRVCKALYGLTPGQIRRAAREGAL